MSSDTPRTDAAYAAYFRPGATLYDLADEMKNIERELNDTNAVSLRYAYEIDRLKEEIEQNAWKSSPALAQAQIDQLKLRIVRLETALQKINELTRDPWSADVAFHAINGTEIQP